MKKNWFSLRLYLEAIRQLRLIGIMGMVILGLEAILIPVGRLMTIRDTQNFMSRPITKVLLNFPEMHPLLVLCFCVLAPLMVLYLFHFLNKRNASDFYHAIPETRLCLYISFFAAVITWLFAIIVLTSCLSLAIFLCFPVYFSVNLTSVLVMCFNVFAGCLLVAASVAVAMCVTGTIFTNIIVSLMIIFIPRMLIFMLVSSVTSSLPLVSSADFIPLLDIGYNVPVGTVFMLGSGSTLSNWQSGVYTLVLGLLYTVCAALLFRVRRSEAAGQAAPNRILQAIYRLVLAMVVCSFACYGIFQDTISRTQYTNYRGDIYGYIVLYVIALVVFFLYELITTRKWRNLVRAVPSLLVLVLLNAALVGGMTGLYRSALSFTPAADDITSIRILSNGRSSNYFTARTAHIPITDENARSVVARQLSAASKSLRRSQDSYYRYIEQATIVRVAIRSGGITHVRNIPMWEDDLAALARPLADIEEYRNIYQQLPKMGENSTTVNLGDSNGLASADIRKIYETLREEVASMPFEKWYPLIASQNSQRYYGVYYTSDILQKGQDRSLNILHISTAIGTNRYSFSVLLDPTLEKTCNVYLQQFGQLSSNKLSQNAIIQALSEGKWSRSGDSLMVIGYNVRSGQSAWEGTTIDLSPLSNRQDAAALANDLTEHLNDDFDITKPLYYIVLQLQDRSSQDGENYTRYIAYFQAGSSEVPAFFDQGKPLENGSSSDLALAQPVAQSKGTTTVIWQP